MTFAGFPADALTFLAELRENNDREWFAEHKPRYEEVIREPALEVIRACEKPLRKISPFYIAEPKRSGGSLLRIYRDIRFRKDKTPFKTHLAIRFRHEIGRDNPCPDLYLHLEPESAFLAGGMWQPPREPLLAIREAIAAKPTEWRRATRGKRFESVWSMWDDSLTRPPQGFDKDHPAIEELKRKSFAASTEISPTRWLEPTLVEESIERFKTLRPMLRFLGDAVGTPL